MRTLTFIFSLTGRGNTRRKASWNFVPHPRRRRGLSPRTGEAIHRRRISEPGSLRFGRDDTKMRSGREKIRTQNLESRAGKIARCTRCLSFNPLPAGEGKIIQPLRKTLRLPRSRYECPTGKLFVFRSPELY